MEFSRVKAYHAQATACVHATMSSGDYRSSPAAQQSSCTFAPSKHRPWFLLCKFVNEEVLFINYRILICGPRSKPLN